MPVNSISSWYFFTICHLLTGRIVHTLPLSTNEFINKTMEEAKYIQVSSSAGGSL